MQANIFFYNSILLTHAVDRARLKFLKRFFQLVEGIVKQIETVGVIKQCVMYAGVKIYLQSEA